MPYFDLEKVISEKKNICGLTFKYFFFFVGWVFFLLIFDQFVCRSQTIVRRLRRSSGQPRGEARNHRGRASYVRSMKSTNLTCLLRIFGGIYLTQRENATPAWSSLICISARKMWSWSLAVSFLRSASLVFGSASASSDQRSAPQPYPQSRLRSFLRAVHPEGI